MNELHSESINEIAAALNKAQGEIKSAVKDASNPFFKSKYADLAGIWDACQVPLTKNGLAFSSVFSYDETSGKRFINSFLIHTSGQWITSVLPLNPAKDDAQGMGSVITYYRRYSLAAMVGVTTDDDDGEAASGRGNSPAGHLINRPKADPEPSTETKTETKTEPKTFGEVYAAAKLKDKANGGTAWFEKVKAMMNTEDKTLQQVKTPQQVWDEMKL